MLTNNHDFLDLVTRNEALVLELRLARVVGDDAPSVDSFFCDLDSVVDSLHPTLVEYGRIFNDIFHRSLSYGAWSLKSNAIDAIC
jgi:hypothetical protein